VKPLGTLTDIQFNPINSSPIFKLFCQKLMFFSGNNFANFIPCRIECITFILVD
jgi:hypothetical protein